MHIFFIAYFYIIFLPYNTHFGHLRERERERERERGMFGFRVSIQIHPLSLSAGGGEALQKFRFIVITVIPMRCASIFRNVSLSSETGQCWTPDPGRHGIERRHVEECWCREVAPLSRWT